MKITRLDTSSTSTVYRFVLTDEELNLPLSTLADLAEPYNFGYTIVRKSMDKVDLRIAID